jgi:hypothetical protein
MSTGKNLIYPLLFALAGCTHRAQAIEPVRHVPIAELSNTLKGNGQERIAQGVEDVLAKDTTTGKPFTARSPLLLTANSQTGEWTVSVVNDKVYGSILLTGTDLQRISSDQMSNLSTFDRQKAAQVIARLYGWGPAYYSDEIKRYQSEGFHRAFTGRFSATSEPIFEKAMQPAFVDVLVSPQNDAGFAVLVVDQSGACAKIAFGSLFSEKH